MNLASNQLAHLHVHSYYSLLEGLVSPNDLAHAAKAAGMTALALTDHRYLSGAVEFYLACKKIGIHPILGLEIDLKGNLSAAGAIIDLAGRIVLLAENEIGWSNLCRISSQSLIDTQDSAQVASSLQIISCCADGLICLTGGERGPLGGLLRTSPAAASVLLSELNAIFPGRLYVEIQRQIEAGSDSDSGLIELATRAGIPLVATHMVEHLLSDDAPLQRTLAAIRLNQRVSQVQSASAALPNAMFLTGDQLAERFIDLPEALATIQEIIERCQFNLTPGTTRFPRIPVPDGLTALDVLRRKAENGARRLYGKMTPEIQTRLDHEIETIGSRGYEPLFLIMEEVISYARNAGIPTASRGSASSSLVAHCLGITTPDPVGLNLYFERFLNPARSSPPDIDTDLCSRRRDEVIHHVFEVYGSNQVAMVGTINRFRPRSALGEVAKAHGMTPGEVSSLVRSLPHHYFNDAEIGNDQFSLIDPYAALRAQYPQPGYQLIFEEAFRLLGLPRHLSVHPGGIVITPGPVTDYAPIVYSDTKDVSMTQLDHHALETLGLVKLDLLGIRGLTVLGDLSQAIYSWRRTEFRQPLDVLEAVPLEDTDTSAAVCNGKTIGCFQIESPGMRATLKQIKARSIQDIMVALALYRPGPLKGGLKESFVKRHTGQEAVNHIHPSLRVILDESHGVILYQEQVLRIAHEIAGLTLAEADLLRRAMSHFDPGKQMQDLRNRFIAGAQEKNNIITETAAHIWEMMAAFAGYGFPKAHAASYALVAWRSAWFKTHYPAEFMAAVLANWGGYYSQNVYLMEARRMKLTVRPPHINHSQQNFCVSYSENGPVLYMGLDQIRDLTHRTQNRIKKHRPYSALEGFLAQVNPSREEVRRLALAGAFEGICPVYEVLHRIESSTFRPGQPALFNPYFEEPISDNWSSEQIVAGQLEALGISVDIHPLELVGNKIRSSGVISTIDAAEQVGKRVMVAGVRQVLHRSRTANGHTMAFLTLEDLDGSLDVVIFPGLYEKARNFIGSSAPIIIEGVVEIDEARGDLFLRAERIEPI